MEAINGWIKAELFMDFHVTDEKPVNEEIDDYMQFHIGLLRCFKVFP